MLLALDPSIGRCGVALFWEGKLIHAGVVVDKGRGNILRRVLGISRGVMQWTLEIEDYYGVEEIAAEWPIVYKAEKSKGDPKHLVPLAGVCGAVAGLFDVDEVNSYLPSDWTGQVPKVETVKGCKGSPRAKKIKARLSKAELVIWNKEVKYHDTIDAIGIGLHHLGRFDRKRVWGR